MQLQVEDKKGQSWTASGGLKNQLAEVIIQRSQAISIPDCLPLNITLDVQPDANNTTLAVESVVKGATGALFRFPRSQCENSGFVIKDQAGDIIADCTFEYG